MGQKKQLIHPEGTFYHGINLSDFLPCWNISLTGKLSSPDFSAACDTGLAQSHTPIRELSIEYLRSPDTSKSFVCAPRSINIWLAGAARATGGLQTPTNPPKPLPDSTVQKIIDIADSEIEFERIRREVAPNAVSRLSYIYLADCTEAGRKHIESMLKNRHIVEVKIPCAFNVTKADRRWVDEYFRNL